MCYVLVIEAGLTSAEGETLVDLLYVAQKGCDASGCGGATDVETDGVSHHKWKRVFSIKRAPRRQTASCGKGR